jgi:hypothetical protein
VTECHHPCLIDSPAGNFTSSQKSAMDGLLVGMCTQALLPPAIADASAESRKISVDLTEGGHRLVGRN